MRMKNMNTKISDVKVIAFDADDTLWSNEPYFREAEHQFETLIAPFAIDTPILDELFTTEMANMESLGYGAKAFTISLVETAVRISHGHVPNDVIIKIMNVGKSLLKTPMSPLDGVVDTLTYLRSMDYKLVVATKGEQRDQRNKLRRSGLDSYFDFVDVMQDKSEDEYRRLMQILGIRPEELVMVGNSFKSDIMPVLNLGGYGVHIPFEITWQHEQAEVFDHPHLVELTTFRELKNIFKGKKVNITD